MGFMWPPSYLLLAIPLILLLALLVLWAGSLLSLDRDRRHARASAALPELDAGGGPTDGLVQVRCGDLSFRARVANFASDGEVVIMLHGFPQTSAAWAPLIESVAARGYRALAIDQRGYSPGARPAGVDAYTIDKLVGDVLAVADQLGIERFHLVGHDWGAAVGWALVMTRPERVISWSALSIAHSLAFIEAVRNDREQRRKSAYILLFRLPWLPEALLAWGGHLLLRRVMYRWMPNPAAREYLAVFAEPGALTSVLNWYRAMGRRAGLDANPDITLPVLFIWGNRDPAAGRSAVDDTARYVHGEYRFMELDAGHWLMERRTEAVLEAIQAHLDAHRGRKGGAG
jgi:pimeloyl-ACP methyl ester carboxylesterase